MDDKYSDELLDLLKELNQTRDILHQVVQKPLEEIEEKLSVNELTELGFTIEPLA